MKVEPTVDHAALIARVAELYDLPVTSLTFVPEGEASIAYVVGCADGARYFLKLWANKRQGRPLQNRLQVVLPITRELYERDLLRNLSYPIVTIAGSLHADVGEYALALFPYIEGPTLLQGTGAWPAEDVYEQLACAMARLHQATTLLHSELPRQSAFEMSFAADLRRGLEDLDDIEPRHGPGKIGLRDLLLPRRDALIDLLARAEQLAEVARERATQLVLCHTDMGGSNSIVGATGTVHILDWDDMILAPAEHDLQEFRHGDFARFVGTYRGAGGVATLDPLQFTFYLQRRYLADLADWLLRILEENTDPAQDAFDLAGIAGYSLAGLDGFAAEIAAITRAIR